MPHFLVDVQMAWVNLVEHGRRTLFLAGAIAVVTGLFVALNAVSAGIRRTLVETSTTLTSGDLNVAGFYKVTAGQATTAVIDYPRVRQAVTAALPEIDFVVQRGRGWGKIVSDRGTLQRAVSGIDLEHETALKRVLVIRSGNIADLARPNTLLIFESQAKRLHLQVGDTVTISSQSTPGSTNTLDCRVVAIARDIGLLSEWNVFVSNASLRELFQWRDDVTSVLMIHLKPGLARDLGELAERLRRALEQHGYQLLPSDPRPQWLKFESVTHEDWTGQKLDVTTWEDELSFITWTVKALQGLSLTLIGILLAIVVTGIANTLWIAVRERTREIGTLRAIGMQRWGIARLFLLEAFLLGAAGATAGGVLGVAGVAALNAARIQVPMSVQLLLMRDTLQLVVEPAPLAAALLLLTFVTCLAALHPSLRAAQRRPVDAMAHFG